jgi:hypothetical protein
VRRALDLEHWAAFRISFDRLTDLLQEVGSGKRGKAPASIVILGGDVHHAYLAEVAFPRSAEVHSAVYQAVCSAMRNPLGDSEKRAIRIAASRLGDAIGRRLARLAGGPDPQDNGCERRRARLRACLRTPARRLSPGPASPSPLASSTFLSVICVLSEAAGVSRVRRESLPLVAGSTALFVHGPLD